MGGWVRALHRWLGLGCGIVLAAVALSGSVLVFQQPLLRWQHPRLAAGAAPAAAEAARVLPRLLDEWRGRGLRTLDFPRPALPAWQGYFADGSRRYFAPDSGALLLERTPAGDALLWLRELHVHLLAGEAGERVLGACGFAALFLLGSGLWQWWPPRGRRLAMLRLLRRPAPAAWLSWHRSAGVVALPLVALAVVTGTAMIYGTQVRAALRLAFAEGPDVAAPAAPALIVAEPDWPAIVAVAEGAVPGAHLSRMSVPAEPGGLATFRLRAEGEWHPVGRSLAWVDVNDARVLKSLDARAQGPGSRINEAVYPVHGAFVGGWLWQAASALAGLVLAGLFATGAGYWLLRGKRGQNQTSAGASMRHSHHEPARARELHEPRDPHRRAADGDAARGVRVRAGG